MPRPYGPSASGRPSPTSEKGVGAGRRPAQKRPGRPISNRRRDGGTGQTGNEFTPGCTECVLCREGGDETAKCACRGELTL